MPKIEIYVIGCAKCVRLERNLEEALKELRMDEKITRIVSIEEIKKRGIMRAPVLFLDGEPRVIGHVPSVEELKSMLVGGPAP